MGVVAEELHADYAVSQVANENVTPHSPTQAAELINSLVDRPVPSLKRTLSQLSEFEKQPNASIPKVVEILHRDPGYSQQLISSANAKLLKLKKDEVYSLSHAVLVLGVPKIIAVGRELPVLEDVEDQQSLTEIYRCLSCSYHAAVQARELTRERGKAAAEAAFLSAQLRDLYLVSLWYYVPDKIRALQKKGNLAQLCFPGGLLNAVGQETAKHHLLPETLQQSYQPDNKSAHLVKCTDFACNLAHLAQDAGNGWYSKRITELIEQTATWIGYDENLLHSKAHQNAVLAARETSSYPVVPIATRLVELEMPVQPDPEKPIQKPEKKPSPAKPVVDVLFHDQLFELLNMSKNDTPANILKFAFGILNEELANHPCTFLLMDKARNCLKSRYMSGFAGTTSTIILPLDKQNIFRKLMQKQLSVWINPETRADFKHLLPGDIKLDVKNKNFIAMSLFVSGKPVGLFYAEVDMSDPNTPDYYKKLKALCKTTRASMEEVQKHAKS